MMKKILAIILSMALILSVFGASLTVTAQTVTYYVSDNGSDSNDGLSPETPLKTIGAVNAMNLSSGARVLFERGSIWRGETLLCQSNVYYGAYGTGTKPAFYGSYENYARKEYWELTNVANVYKTTFTLEEDIGAIVFDNGQQIAVRYINNEKPSNLWGDGMFIYSNTDKCVYLRCTSGNPGEIYSDIEFIQHWELINGNNANNVTIEDITLKYANFGYNALDSQNNITLRGLEIAYIGGRYKNDGSVRLGNGIQFYGNNFSDITVDECIVTQCYDTAFTCQMYGGRNVSFQNVNVTDCEFSYCYWTVEMWYRPYNELIDYATISNVNFTGNTFAYAGYGFGSGYPYIADPLRFWNDGANSATLVNNMIFDNYNGTPDVNFTNNTFCVSKDYLFFSSYDMDFSGNTYIVDDNTKIGMLGSDTPDKTLISELDSLSFEPDAQIKYAGEITSTASKSAYNVMENSGFETVYAEDSEPTEYITNGSFDDRDTGWTVPYGDWSVITDSSTGNKMVKITPYACNLRQLDIELLAGTYELSFRAKSDNADYTSEILVDYANDVNVKVLSKTFDIKSAGFSNYTFVFTVETAGKYNVKIGKNGGDPQNKYIDDVSLKVYKESSFEESKGANLSEEDGWYCESNLVYSTDEIRGERSLVTSSANVNGAFNVRGNVPYKLSWWYKGASNITVTDENGAVLCEKAFSSDDWEYYEYYFTTPENCKRISITLSGDSLYDEFILSPYPEYNIYVFDKGMIASADKRFVKGDNIEFFTYPDEGYVLDSANACTSADGTVLSATTTNKTDCYALNANQNISFCGEFIPADLHKISVSEDILYGTVETISKAVKGDKVQITLIPENGYFVKDGSVRVYTSENDIETTCVSENVYSFVMPDYDVMVYAEFEYRNSLESGMVDLITNGSFDDGNTGWTVPYGDWSIITDSSTGNKMVKITPYACNLRQLDIELPAGTYELSFRAKSDNADYTSEILVDYANDINVKVLSKTFDIKSAGFSYYTFVFTVETAGKYNVKIGKNGKDPQNKYIDDVKLLTTYSVYLDSQNVLMTDEMIYGLNAGTTSDELNEKFVLENANLKYSSEELSTGDTVTLCVGNKELWTKVLSVKGDINSNGTVSVTDLVALKKYLAGNKQLKDEELQAAKISGEPIVSANSLVSLRMILLNK